MKKKKDVQKIWVTIVRIINEQGEIDFFPLSAMGVNKFHAMKAIAEQLREAFYVDERGELLPYVLIGFKQKKPDEVQAFMDTFADFMSDVELVRQLTPPET